MHSLVVHVSDPQGFNEQTTVELEDGMSLGEALHQAMDELEERCGGSLAFPIFIDIHPTADFASHSWMYEPKHHAPITIRKR